jgi:hypothetical protein
MVAVCRVRFRRRPACAAVEEREKEKHQINQNDTEGNDQHIVHIVLRLIEYVDLCWHNLCGNIVAAVILKRVFRKKYSALHKECADAVCYMVVDPKGNLNQVHLRSRQRDYLVVESSGRQLEKAKLCNKN